MSAPFDVDAWLNEPVTVTNRILDARADMPRHQRICFLLMANGGFDVHGWGTISYGGPGGHQQGLEMNDAIELIQVASFLAGVRATGIDWNAVLLPYFTAYVERWKQPS